eukprot:gene6727-10892_t
MNVQARDLKLPDKLTHLWNINGTTSSERENKKAELIELINTFVAEEIIKQEQVQEEYEDNILLERKNIENLHMILGMKHVLPNLDGKNLLEKINLVRSEKEDLIRIKKDREHEKKVLLEQIIIICNEIDLVEDLEKFNSLPDDLSIEIIKYLKESFKVVQEKKDSRKNDVNAISKEIFYLFKILGENKDTSSYITHEQKTKSFSISEIDDILWNPSDHERIPLNQSFLNAIVERRDQLKLEYTNRLTFIKEILREIENLYQKLQIPVEDQINTKDPNWENPTKKTMRQLEQLFTQLEERKKLLLKEFISNALSELENLREELGLEEEEEIYDEDDNIYYGMLEQEVDRLQKCKEEFHGIKSSISKIEDLKKDLKEVNQSVYDPNRYKDSKRLFREEGIRKRAKALPTLTAQIKGRIIEFEKKHDVPIYFGNEKYLTIIEAYETELAESAPKRTSIINRTSSDFSSSSSLNSTMTSSKYKTPNSKLRTTKTTTSSSVQRPATTTKVGVTKTLSSARKERFAKTPTSLNKTIGGGVSTLGSQKKPLKDRNL